MLLFEEMVENLLPYDGAAAYHPRAIEPVESNGYFHSLLTSIEWKHDETVVMGRRVVTKRMVAWYGDEAFEYAYSGTSKTALPWTKELIELRDLAEDVAGARFNSCLLNLYQDGSAGLGWHADNEDSLVKNAAIASVSLGATRRFDLMHRKTKEKVSIVLEDGSILVMKGETQTHWLHSLPKTTKVTEPRINLTFRSMFEGQVSQS